MALHLVTGGSGFLGNLIARRLYEKGEEVRILDIWEDDTRPKAIDFINCDIRDRNGLKNAMKNVDFVHHNVALVPLTKSGKKFWDVNVVGSMIAAEEAAKANVRGFIHMSSSALYGVPDDSPITAKTPLRPVEVYGRAKLFGELAVRRVCRDNGLPLVVIRPRTILGEGRLGIFQILFSWIKEGKNVYVIGDGKIKFQFVHALDLIDAYMLIISKEKPGIYNVGTDVYGYLKDELELLIKYANTESTVRELPVDFSIILLKLLDYLGLSPLAPWHYLTYHKEFHFDVSNLVEMGWTPKYSNYEMLKESYEWFLDNPNLIENKKALSPHRRDVKEGILSLVKKF